jgi:hypothetical protein
MRAQTHQGAVFQARAVRIREGVLGSGHWWREDNDVLADHIHARKIRDANKALAEKLEGN